MKIMHTSDWHIGKKTENVERLAEQREVLDEIISIANDNAIELVLVAGDVFDTFIPSAEAERLFYEKVTELAKNRAVLIIPGNHDDAVRLCAAESLAEVHGVYFAGNLESSHYITEKVETNVSLNGRGEGYCIFENINGEQIYVATLPYPTEARFKEKSTGEGYAERVKGWLDKCMSANVNNLPAIVMTHLFTLGGITTEGEREISLGGARAFPKGLFPDCAYVALGHLHKRQVVDATRNIIYSGSILQYSFDEVNVEKSVTLFDVVGGAVCDLRTVSLTKGKRLAKLSACSIEQAAELLNGYADHLVELTLKLKSPLNREENNYLHTNFPNVISLKLEVEATGSYATTGRRELSDDRLFAECYKKQYGTDPDENMLSLYLEILSEVERT